MDQIRRCFPASRCAHGGCRLPPPSCSSDPPLWRPTDQVCEFVRDPSARLSSSQPLRVGVSSQRGLSSSLSVSSLKVREFRPKSCSHREAVLSLPSARRAEQSPMAEDCGGPVPYQDWLFRGDLRFSSSTFGHFPGSANSRVKNDRVETPFRNSSPANLDGLQG